MSQNQELVEIFKAVWEWYKKDRYIYQKKDFVNAQQYLNLMGDFDKEMIEQRTRVYLKDEFYKKCGHNFSAFINNIASFVPDKWKCKFCSEEFTGNMSQKNHQNDCSKNPKFKVNELPKEMNGELDNLCNKFKITTKESDKWQN